jgi:CheY-like chemotaxis protein
MIEVKCILLVEDNANDVELTLEGLAEFNLANSVVTVSDGAEALDFLFYQGKYASRPEGNPAVIMLDLKLPKVDGHEVLKRVKEDPRTRNIPVVILTSSREEQDLVRGYHNGANAFVVKPVIFHEFISAVKNLGIFWVAVNEPPPKSIRKAT